MADLIAEAARLKEWATAIPAERRHGEWECEYHCWGDLYDAALGFVDAVPFGRWSSEEKRAMLFAIARDNEVQHLAGEIRSRKPETLVALTEAAIENGERDAKWQLAEELGELGERGGESERLLLTLARDDDEYVRRRSLHPLARLGSPSVEGLALVEWHRPDVNQQWARMNVLWCLHRIGSPHLAQFLAEAERDERKHLFDFVQKIRRGEADR